MKRFFAIFFIVLALSFINISSIACTQERAGISVFAAAGAKPALDEIGRKFEEAYGVKVEIAYGGGGDALNQMVLSESGDIYIAPEQSFMDKAKELNAIDSATIESIAYMIPVIAVQEGNPLNILSLDDLTRPGINVGVTRAETTLLGKYAPEIFSKAGLAEGIGTNIVTEAIRPDSLLANIIMGQVDAGIIWHFYEYQALDDIEVIFMSPEQLTGIGEMQIAMSTYCVNEVPVRQFINFITSVEGKGIFKRYGYLTDIEEVSEYWHQDQ